MKKLFLLFMLLSCLSVYSSELTEDYTDIAAEYCTFGKYREALPYVEKILQEEPQNSEALNMKNAILRVTNPNSGSYLTRTFSNIKKASDYKNEGNRNGEISALSSINDYWSNFLLARIYSENNDFQNSINYYNKAININPENSTGYLGLGRNYLLMKDYSNAVSNLNIYIEKNPNSAVAYALRAEAYMNTDKIEEALNDIQKALKLDENTSYLLIEAKILSRKGDYEIARNKFINLAKTVQTSEVYKYIGLCDFAMSDYTNALINLDKAIILSDDDKDLVTIYNKVKEKLRENEKGNSNK